MELQRYIGIGLSGSRRALARVLEGLTQEEVSWRPASGCNSIGLILFHMARSEDTIFQKLLQKEPTLWESEQWFEKLGLAEEEEGGHYSAEQVDAFREPQLGLILEFYDAVRTRTKEKLRRMTGTELDEIITFPILGEMPIAALFSFVINHSCEHIGEISYLRGMQRGIDK